MSVDPTRASRAPGGPDGPSGPPAPSQPPAPSVAGPGGLRLELAGAPVACVDTRRIELAPTDALLLAWLALEGATPRERLAALLWPESAPEAARNALRQRLFRLKRQLGADVVDGTTLLALAPGTVHDLGVEADGVLGTLSTPECPELDAWLAQRRGARQGRLRQELAARIEAFEAAGDAAAALPLAQQLLALDPLSEDAHRRVIRLHYVRGDRAAAMLAFDRCEQVLKHEVGTAPSPATLELLKLIESGAEHAPPPTAPGWSGPLPAAVLRPPRLVGRDAELAALREAWRRGALPVVSGEAGIGKSRLLQALREGQRGVALASARPGDRLVPYASAARLLREVHALAPAALAALPRAQQERLAPLLPGVAPEPAAPQAGGSSLAGPAAAFLAAAGPPLAPLAGLILDDLHFADDASLDLIEALAPGPARWCLGLRPPAPGTRQHALLEALARSAPLSAVAVLPLSVPQLAELVDSMGLPGVSGARIAPALRQRSGGNPLFALETLKTAWSQGRFDVDAVLAGGPSPSAPAGSAAAPGMLARAPSLMQLIGEQLARLSPPALALARVAALAGIDFTLELAEQVLKTDALALADPWAELERERVLVGTEFAHDLVYEAVLAGVPAVIARALHGRIAALLEAAGGEPARVAAHWEAAGERAKALPGLRAAAERAHRALREVERIEILRRAAEIAEASGQRAVAFDCLQRAVDSHMNAIRDEGGFPLLDRMDALAATDAERALSLGMRAWYLSQLPDHEQAVAAGTRALAMAEPLADRALAGPIRQRLATSLSMLGRFDEALAHLRAVEPWAAEALPGDVLAEFHGNFAVVLDNLGRPAEASGHHRLALATSGAQGDHAQRVTHLANHGVNRLNAGDAAGALALAQQAEALIASYALQGASVAFVQLLRSQAARALGDFDGALAAADRALEGLEVANPARRSTVWVHRALVWLELGQFARAGQDLQQAGAGDTLPRYLAARRLLLVSRWQRALGQDGAPALAEALATAPPNGWPEVRMTIEVEQAVQAPHADADRPARAAAIGALARLRDRAAAQGLAGSVLAASLHEAVLAAAAEPARAAALAREALALADGVAPTLRPRAEVWWGAARALAPAAPEEARRVARAGRLWLLDTAARHVAEPFRESFLHRVPCHAELMAAGP